MKNEFTVDIVVDRVMDILILTETTDEERMLIVINAMTKVLTLLDGGVDGI